MITIFRKILAVLAALIMFPISAFAYNVVDLPNSMTFADALGIFDVSEIESATVSDLEHNTYKALSSTEIKDFYYAAANVTVWRKVNPTPFRGACVNFTTKSGAKISYYFDSGIQIGTYGVDNYICYMPASDDAVKLSYLRNDFYDSTEGVYGGAQWNVSTARDFLKLPSEQWAQSAIKVAAAKSLVPYEFTNIYEKNITREEFAELLANLIVVAGNYASMDAYMNATGTVYLTGNFSDCVGRSETIDQLFAIGIISGRTETLFEPDGAVSRQEAAAVMTRVANLFMYVGTNDKLNCTDKSGVADWANFYVRWILDKGIMTLDDGGYFYPGDSMSVQQAIAAVSRLYDLVTYWES